MDCVPPAFGVSRFSALRSISASENDYHIRGLVWYFTVALGDDLYEINKSRIPSKPHAWPTLMMNMTLTMSPDCEKHCHR